MHVCQEKSLGRGVDSGVIISDLFSLYVSAMFIDLFFAVTHIL